MLQRYDALKATTLLVATSTLLATACDTTRDRPFGVQGAAPATDVVVVSPTTDAVVPSDSVAPVVVRASGSLHALELFLVRVALPDTFATQRLDFDPPRPEVEATFELAIPDLETGVHLEIRAAAEDGEGTRHLSEPVVVLVIECDRFPIACGSEDL